MYIPKRYGQSKVDNCPFCGKFSTCKNKQGISVCTLHKDDEIDDVKCACGEYLDILEGKYGVFFKCMKCGNMNLRKVMEMNQIRIKTKTNPSNNYSSKPKYSAQSYSKPKHKKEFTVRSDDPRYFS